MIRFLLATLLYRLANGLLFLSVAWLLVRGSDQGAMSLAISSIAGFLPAVLIAPFAKPLIERVDSRQLTWLGIAAMLLLTLLFVPFLGKPTAVLVINCAVLLVFFLLEGTWDALLATLIKQLPSAQADKMNARQSAVMQAGLMTGGLPLGLLIQWGGASLSFYVSACLYVAAIVLLLAVPRAASQRTVGSGESQAPAAQASLSGRAAGARVPWYMLVALSLVWPCLTLVNMAIPLLANAQGNGAVEHAAVLDTMIGLGMACAGFVASSFIPLFAQGKRRYITLFALMIPLPFLELAVVGYGMEWLVPGFFASGLGFGFFRIGMRKYLIARLPSHQVGQMVFTCNAYGFPVLAVCAFFYAITWASGPVIPLAVFSLFALTGACSMCVPLAKDEPGEDKGRLHETTVKA